MSAPTEAHESRVAMLDAAAALAGFPRPCTWPGLRPDVCRTDGQGGLWLGDAKDTETPGNEATRGRWGRYVRRAHQLLDRGEIRDVSLIVCCPAAVGGWRDLLVRVAELEGLRVGSHGIDTWGEGYDVAWAIGGVARGC